MSIFSKRKEQSKELCDNNLDNNKIEAYVEAFMGNNQIDPKMVMVQDIQSSFADGGYQIVIKAAFPGKLLGVNGQTSAKLARGLSKLFDCRLRLFITD